MPEQNRCTWCGGVFKGKEWAGEICEECSLVAEELAKERGRPASKGSVLAERERVENIRSS